MKLLAKYNRITIPVVIAIFLLTTVAFYFVLHYILQLQLDKDLRIEQSEILHFVQQNDSLPRNPNYKDQQIFFQPATGNHFNQKFTSVKILSSDDDEAVIFRRLQFWIQAHGKYYLATVQKSQQETEDIIQIILLVTFFFLILLLLLFFIVNRFTLRNLWRPFFENIRQLEQFNIAEKGTINFTKSSIDEFKALNKAATSMTNKIRSDFDSLKSFTENASHEIQTPLSVIKNKIELLSQSESLQANDVVLIRSLEKEVSRLAKLNQSLLLLAKIENGQFIKGHIDLSLIVQECLLEVEDLIHSRSIIVEKNIANHVMMQISEPLAIILIGNLIYNAIRHNEDSGEIFITLTPHKFKIRNTGKEPQIEPSQFFERFCKGVKYSGSLGLGLSIVKKIIDISAFKISYKYENPYHIIEIEFHHANPNEK